MRFSPIYYHNPGSKSHSPSGQTILFGCPLELRTVGKLKKIPPILEYLLDSVRVSPAPNHDVYTVGETYRNDTTNSLYCKSGEYWSLVNEIEQAWSGVEERDRAIISKLLRVDVASLILVCLLRYTIPESSMFLQEYLLAHPEPILSHGDIAMALKGLYNGPNMIWSTWSKDPIKAGVIRAIVTCQVRLGRVRLFDWDMADALAQKSVCFIWYWKWRKYIT